METPCWCKHGSCKVTETFCHCILLFKWNVITLELRHMEINTTSRARNVQLAKTYTITNLLICVRALFGCHSMSWIINLEIQMRSVTKWRILSSLHKCYKTLIKFLESPTFDEDKFSEGFISFSYIQFWTMMIFKWWYHLETAIAFNT